MDNKQDLKQMIQTNKAALDDSYSMMVRAYEQNKLILDMILELGQKRLKIKAQKEKSSLKKMTRL